MSESIGINNEELRPEDNKILLDILAEYSGNEASYIKKIILNIFKLRDQRRSGGDNSIMESNKNETTQEFDGEIQEQFLEAYIEASTNIDKPIKKEIVIWLKDLHDNKGVARYRTNTSYDLEERVGLQAIVEDFNAYCIKTQRLIESNTNSFNRDVGVNQINALGSTLAAQVMRVERLPRPE